MSEKTRACMASIHYVEVSSGEIGFGLELDDVEGTVYVSAPMLRALIARAIEDGFDPDGEPEL